MNLKERVFTCVLWVGFATFAYADQSTNPKVDYISPPAVREFLKKNSKVTFIDVREPKEFEMGHIEGAINIGYDQIEKRAKKELPRDRTYIAYCIYSAWRAPYAANTLVDLGYKDVYILEGGISAWNAGGQVIYASQPNIKPSIPAYHPDQVNLKHPKDREYKVKVELTLEELSKYDGRDGRPAYVAVNGIIYDLTESRLWRGGAHDPSKGVVTAGRDLTEILKESPHGDKHLKDFPIVGKLIQ